MSERIAHAFARGQEEARALLVAYLCAGDPDARRSLAACRALLNSGVDILELGVPFSDPLADGKTNQAAAERALASGMTQEQVFALVRTLRAETHVPIVLYTYYNLVYRLGHEAYASACIEAGVDGVLVLDLPPEEAGPWCEAAQAVDLKTVFLIAPTTPPERMERIAACAQGFIYYVSREGVTGMRQDVASDLQERLALIRKATDLPVVVGFGLSKPEQVAAVAQVADGAVVGSYLVHTLAAHAASEEGLQAALEGAARPLVAALAKEA